MGLISASVMIPLEYSAITGDEARILAEAANHSFIPAYVSDLNDGYFTVEEDRRAASQLVRREPVTMCSCSAHHFLTDPTISRQQREDVQLLIRSNEPLTDNGGSCLAPRQYSS